MILLQQSINFDKPVEFFLEVIVSVILFFLIYLIRIVFSVHFKSSFFHWIVDFALGFLLMFSNSFFPNNFLVTYLVVIFYAVRGVYLLIKVLVEIGDPFKKVVFHIKLNNENERLDTDFSIKDLIRGIILSSILIAFGALVAYVVFVNHTFSKSN